MSVCLTNERIRKELTENSFYRGLYFMIPNKDCLKFTIVNNGVASEHSLPLEKTAYDNYKRIVSTNQIGDEIYENI